MAPPRALLLAALALALALALTLTLTLTLPRPARADDADADADADADTDSALEEDRSAHYPAPGAASRALSESKIESLWAVEQLAEPRKDLDMSSNVRKLEESLSFDVGGATTVVLDERVPVTLAVFNAGSEDLRLVGARAFLTVTQTTSEEEQQAVPLTTRPQFVWSGNLKLEPGKETTVPVTFTITEEAIPHKQIRAFVDVIVLDGKGRVSRQTAFAKDFAPVRGEAEARAEDALTVAGILGGAAAVYAAYGARAKIAARIFSESSRVRRRD